MDVEILIVDIGVLAVVILAENLRSRVIMVFGYRCADDYPVCFPLRHRIFRLITAKRLL